MFQKFYRKIFGGGSLPTPVLEKPNHLLAFILLEQEGMPAEEKLIASFRKFSQGHHQLSIAHDEDDAENGANNINVVAWNIEGAGSGFLAHMDMPVPNGEAEAHFERSVSSFSHDAVLPGHRAHLMLNFMPGQLLSATEAMMIFTDMLAAATESSASVGVYYGNAHVTHTREFFLNLAAEREINPRVLLWNGISKAREDGNMVSILSHGMEELALPDLYLIGKPADITHHLGRMFDLLSYIAQRGAAIPAGDTIGATEKEKIVVEYVPSPADPQKTVCKIRL